MNISGMYKRIRYILESSTIVFRYLNLQLYSVYASECLHKYAEFAAKLDQMVTRMVFESYKVEKYYDPYIETTNYLLRVLKNSAPNNENPTLGFLTHTDKSFTTILHQDQVNGLEMETREGEPININLSSPSLFMIFAGDALMVKLLQNYNCIIQTNINSTNLSIPL